MKKTCFISILCLLVLTGCWDQTEADEFAYVTVIGLEKDEEDDGLVKVTYVIANPEAGSQVGGAGVDEPPVETIVFTASDFIAARSIANSVIAKEITYDLVRVMMVSEEIARDPDFIRWMYDVTKAPEIRRDTTLFVTKENPSTFIQDNRPPLETRPHKYYELIFKRGQNTGTIPLSNMMSFFRITEAGVNVFLGIYGTAERPEERQNLDEPDDFLAGNFYYEGETNETQFAGSAVFKEGSMIDVLTVEETRLTYLLSNVMEQPSRIITSLPDPFHEDYFIATGIRRDGNVQFEIEMKESEPSIHVKVPLHLELLTNHSMTDVANNPNAREQLKTAFEEMIIERFEKLVIKTQEEFGAEPFGWGLEAAKKFRSIPEFAAFDWMKTYPDINITVETEIMLERFGRQADVPDLEDVRD